MGINIIRLGQPTGDNPDITQEDWLAEARRRFGDDPKGWRFRCPSCGTISTPGDFLALGVDGHRASGECIGRVHKEQGETGIDGNTKPCNWAAIGLIRLPACIEVAWAETRANGDRSTLAFPFDDGDEG